jgi:hypothetical protein
LEAMAMAKPVVVTSAAMEGIPGGANLQVTIADSPEKFAEQVMGFLEQPIMSPLENRHYVQADFSWQHNGDHLCGLLNDSGD